MYLLQTQLFLLNLLFAQSFFHQSADLPDVAKHTVKEPHGFKYFCRAVITFKQHLFRNEE
jgi:hypothetical protein